MNENALRLPAGLLSSVRMVFLDLDGTALNGGEELTPATIEALMRLKKRGIPYTFASSRPAAMLGVYCRLANVSGPVIAMEGAEIRIWGTGDTLCQFPIEQSVAADLMQFCHESGMDYTFYTRETAYLRRDTERLQRMRRYNERAAALGIAPASCQFYEAYSPQQIASQQLMKVFVKLSGPGAGDALRSFLKQRPSVRSNYAEKNSVAIVSSGVSKGKAIKRLCGMQNIDVKDVCCFGNYYNDIEMFAQAGYSVAMGNAPEEVKASADYVTASNEEDGVAWFIRQYICGR